MPVRFNRRGLVHLLALCSLGLVFCLGSGMVQARQLDHTRRSAEAGCQQFTFSSDGNPFPLCPGPYPVGGNCVWWAWEQWHLLGYNLPLNWGNAAEWIVDAERFGLPIGTTPRLGSIAVFPVADGVWAFGTAGHVAFVTWVNPDATTFNVTYQDYGDPTPMFTGYGYNVAYINQPRFQDGQMRFIYFPGAIDARRFAQLPGVDGNGIAEVASANAQAQTQTQTQTQTQSGVKTDASNSLSTSRIALGLPPGAYDQEFDADFTGSGYTDLLVYQRQQGRLDVLTFADRYKPLLPHWASVDGVHAPGYETVVPQRVSLGDGLIRAGGWGSSLDIRIGDFNGDGRDDILLYDRVTGQVQLLSLNKDLAIQRHVILAGWGPGWEVYTGRFDGKNSDLLLYHPVQAQVLSTETPTPVPSPSPNQVSNSSPTPSPTSTVGISPTPDPSSSPSPTVTPSPSPTLSPSPTPTLTPTPSPTPSPSPSPSPSPTSSPSPTPSTGVTPTPSPSPTGTATTGRRGGYTLAERNALSVDVPGPGGDLSGESNTDDARSRGASPNVMLVSFTTDFHVRLQRRYTLLQGSWEVYTGRFVSATQDGLFLYDRTSGEARIMDFARTLLVSHYLALDGLGGDWEVHTGDFAGTGRAQILLYNPGTGATRFLAFNTNLSLAAEVSDTVLRAGLVLYVGHFGLLALSVMLYDPASGQSTFVAFDSSLEIEREYTVQSWDQHWQVLVGTFLDRSTCIGAHRRSNGDDVLVLNRSTGQVQQFIFTFGNRYQVFDNRLTSFLREGETLASSPQLSAVDTSSYTLGIMLDVGITDEELY